MAKGGKTRVVRVLAGLLLAVNGAAFLACGWDKWRAVHHRRRVRERTLLLLAAMGGAFGLLLGMRLFHHKTRDPRFRRPVPLLAAGWAALLFLLWRRFGWRW